MDLLENQKINSNKDCSHLDPLKIALDEKYLELVNRKHTLFHQDNVRSHISLMTRQKLLQLGWEVLIHQPHLPDIAPSNFHLFLSLQNSLNGKNFNTLTIKGTWNSSLLKKLKTFGKMEL